MTARTEQDQVLSNLVMLLRSGLDLASCVGALENDARDRTIKKKLGSIRRSLENGALFSQSLAAEHLFSPHAVALIALGERSGRVAENLSVIMEQEKKNRQFRGALQSALLYPSIVLAVALIVGVGVTIFILPRLADLFSQLSIELPLLTRLLVNAGLFIKHAPPLFLPLLGAGLALCLIAFFSNAVGRAWLHSAVGRLPVLGPFTMTVELARMGYVAGTLLEAGVPIVETVSSLADTAPLARWAALYRSLAGHIERGYTLKDFFSQKRRSLFIPRPIQTMLVTAEQSGRLGATFSDIGRIYEEKLENESKRLAIALEPLLLVLVWIGVVFLALAVLLPIYNLIGAINR